MRKLPRMAAAALLLALLLSVTGCGGSAAETDEENRLFDISINPQGAGCGAGRGSTKTALRPKK